MTVKLSLLDRKDFKYTTDSDVYLNADKKYEYVGTCHFFRDESGNHFGELKLNRDVSGELYFYYRNLVNANGDFWFDGLDLMENELKDRPTTQLRDMIV